tara:strand:+ start:20973 stop:21881 length:909 start_codon:yes stop_codon:yes gene_type:complete
VGKGGVRKGAGRPPGTGRFGERVVQMSVPESLVPQLNELLTAHAVNAASKRPVRRLKSDCVLPLPPPGKVRLDGPIGALDQLTRLRDEGTRAAVVMLDPVYRSPKARGRASYLSEMLPLISLAGEIADHVIVWGFPLSVARLVDHQPPHLTVETWITWTYKNSANRARSWRGAQQVALHLRRPKAKLHYQTFLTDQHKEMHARGKLAYLMTPRDVIIEEPLLSGFIRRNEQTGFRAGQKPLSVLTPLLQMTAQPGELVIDPTAGSGTTGEAAAALGCAAILSDRSLESLKISRKRLVACLTD